MKENEERAREIADKYTPWEDRDPADDRPTIRDRCKADIQSALDEAETRGEEKKSSALLLKKMRLRVEEIAIDAERCSRRSNRLLLLIDKQLNEEAP